MALSQQPRTMENLPSEVLSEIFIRLLSKQLAQMRCVCKSWNTLLSESSFVKSHLHHSIHTNNEILLFFPWGFSFDCNSFTARPSHSPDLKLTNFINLPVNHQSKDSCGNVLGSVNGLICFSYGSYEDTNDYPLHIWNPSLSTVLTLPPCSSPDSINIQFRFCFDPKTDDYKVVKLIRCSRWKVEVYSMRKGSWKLTTQKLPSYVTMISDLDEVCVDGILHLICDTDLEWKPETIVAFDLDAETFREIPLPDSILHHPGFHVLGVLAGKLCVMSSIEAGQWEVWMMGEYGVAKSWVKHHVFSQFSGDIAPIGFTLHNEFLFQVNDGFALYDPISTETKTFKTTGGLGVTKIVEYVDSLVWVAPICYSISQFQF